MITLEEIKKQVDEVGQLFKLIDEFSDEIEKVEQEIQEIEAKGEDIRSLEDFRNLTAKKGYLAELARERDNLEFKKINDIASRAQKIDARGYLNATLESTESVKKNRQEIKKKALELLELIETYNSDYKANAYRIAEEVSATGIDDLLAKINQSKHYRGANYLTSGTGGFNGGYKREIDVKDTLGYMIERIEVFEGER